MHFINTYVIKVYLKDFTNRCSWSKCFEDHSIGLFCFFYPHPRICLLILEKEGKGREGQRETPMLETSISCLMHAPQPRIEPAT